MAISQVVIEGNTALRATRQVVKQMATRPEGFWWFRKGEYDEQKVDEDVARAAAALVRRPRATSISR